MSRLVSYVLGVFMLVTAGQAISSIESDDLWLRESVPGAENGAGFGTLKNATTSDISIVDASSEVSDTVEIHRHVHQHGQMAMERMDALLIPAGESVELRPGGYHLMLMQLQEPLKPDDSFQVTLYLDNGEEVQFAVPVKGLLQ